MSNTRATYIGAKNVPAYGTVGDAFPAGGHDDPQSCEYGAYIFVPQGEDGEVAYYVDPMTELEFEETCNASLVARLEALERSR